MNELQIFSNPEFGTVRSVMIDGEPWFVGKDVAAALGYKDAVNALKSHVDTEDKKGWQIATPSRGTQSMTIINESGLYCLVLSSKLPTAKKFKRWVTSEVLPALRKTGEYKVEPPNMERPTTKDDYMAAARILASCRNERLPLVVSMLGKAGLDIGELQQSVKKPANSRLDEAEIAHLDAVLAAYSGVEAATALDLNPVVIYNYKAHRYLPRRSRYNYMISVLDPDNKIK